MPTNDALVLLRETANRVRTGLQDFRKEALKGVPFDPAHDRADYIEVMNKQDWKKLIALAQSLKKNRQKSLADLEKSQKKILKLLPLLDNLDKVSGKLPPPLPKIAGWKECKQKLITALRKKRLSAAAIEVIIKAEEKRDFRKSPKQLRAMLDPAVTRFEKARQRHLASIMGAVHAGAIALFNQGYRKAKPYEAGKTRAWCRANYSMLADGERAVWQMLRNGEPERAAAAAENLRKKAEAGIKKGAEVAASVAARRREPGAGAAENIAALWVAEVMRGLLRAIALGYVAKSALSWGDKTEPTRAWIEAARNLPFEGYASPPAIAVSQLKRKKAGKEYTVAGFVAGVTITHRARKAISAVKIASDKNTAITAVLSHIKLDSAGMVPGAIVRVTGTWNNPIKWFPDGPALVVKRLNYGELSKKGWRDWATAAIRNVYSPIPHGLAAMWTWEPGVNGAGNPLYYGVWYGN